ncbi:hypothetical protein ADUPG1_009519, partial [Aduncisulcus paluster]
QYKMGWFQIPIEKDNIIAIGFIAKESWSSSDDWTAFHSIRVFRSDTEALPFQKAEKIRQKRRLQSVIGASRCLLPADSRIIPISEFKLSEISGVFPEVHVWDKAAIRDIFRKNLYFNFCSLSIPFSHPFDIEYICLELFCHSSAPPPEELDIVIHVKEELLDVRGIEPTLKSFHVPTMKSLKDCVRFPINMKGVIRVDFICELSVEYTGDWCGSKPPKFVIAK